jgi:hypothetical protein
MGRRGKRGNGRMSWMKTGGGATVQRTTTNEINSGEEEEEEEEEGRTTHIITVSYFSTAPLKCPRSWNCLLFPPQILIPPAERAAAAAAVMAMAAVVAMVAELAVQTYIAGRREQQRRRRIQKAKDAKRRFGCRMCRTRCGGKRACTIVRDNCGGGCVVECATECAIFLECHRVYCAPHCGP